MHSLVTCFGAYLYSLGTKHGNLHQSSVTTSRVTFLFCRPTQELASVAATTGKNSARFWRRRKKSERSVKVELISRKKSLAVDEACMAVF